MPMNNLRAPLALLLACFLPVTFAVANPTSESNKFSYTEADISLIVFKTANDPFGVHELIRRSKPLVTYRLVTTNNEMEEIVVKAQRLEPRWQLRKRLSNLIIDKPGGLDWEFLPTTKRTHLQAMNEPNVGTSLLGNQFEPTGGALLFRVTFGR